MHLPSCAPPSPAGVAGHEHCGGIHPSGGEGCRAVPAHHHCAGARGSCFVKGRLGSICIQGRAGKREGGCVHLCLCLCLLPRPTCPASTANFSCPQGTRAWARPLEYYVTHPITAGDGFNVVYETHPCAPGAQQQRIRTRTVQPVTEAVYTRVRQRVCCPTPPNPHGPLRLCPPPVLPLTQPPP